jgi:hypothetical protein
LVSSAWVAPRNDEVYQIGFEPRLGDRTVVFFKRTRIMYANDGTMMMVFKFKFDSSSRRDGNGGLQRNLLQLATKPPVPEPVVGGPAALFNLASCRVT